jgi:hypothetical protein
MHCFIVILKLKTYLQFVTIIRILILQLTTNCFQEKNIFLKLEAICSEIHDKNAYDCEIL